MLKIKKCGSIVISIDGQRLSVSLLSRFSIIYQRVCLPTASHRGGGGTGREEWEEGAKVRLAQEGGITFSETP